MHRVLRSVTLVEQNSEAAFAGLCAFLRSLGLVEQVSGECYLYLWPHRYGAPRQFATVNHALRTATIYLYPDALGLGAGYAARLYRALDDADLGMGSKLGPSIAIDLADEAQLRLFRDGLAELFPANSDRAPAGSGR